MPNRVQKVDCEPIGSAPLADGDTDDAENTAVYDERIRIVASTMRRGLDHTPQRRLFPEIGGTSSSLSPGFDKTPRISISPFMTVSPVEHGPVPEMPEENNPFSMHASIWTLTELAG